MLTATNISLSVAGRELLRDASFVVNAGDKAAIVGRNGVGKSSLVSLLVGEPPPHVAATGEVQVLGSLGHLPQVPVHGGLGTDPSAICHVLSARGLDRLDVALSEARKRMSADPTAENIAVFSDTEERYRTLGGYEAESTLARMADGLGLRQELLFEDADSLSGGQRRRLDLMRVLFGQPEVMVLDEPTNHLDAPAKRWLMGQLDRFSGALLLVSHDLTLLDRSITKVLHLQRGALQEFKGTYSGYRLQLSAREDQQDRLAARQEREVKRLSTLADSMRGGTARRARTAKSFDTRVERLKKHQTARATRERHSRFRLPLPARAGETPLEIRSLAVSYGPARVLHEVSMALHRGDRAVVVGRNGAGKSSLLRCVAGMQQPTTGQVVLGKNVSLGYFAQEHEQVNLDKRAIDNIDDTILVAEADRRALLGSFGLSGELATQLAGSLSGGERAKLGLAMLAAGWANVLVLDEPTNNLDPPSVEAVASMLSAWPGTVVVVSHDRSFVEALEPTHALLLPEERFDYWRDDLLDEVQLR